MTEENEVSLHTTNRQGGRQQVIDALREFGINIRPESLSDIVHDPDYSSGAVFEEKLSAASVLEDGHKTDQWRIFYSNLLNIATEPGVRVLITADPLKTHRYNTNGYTTRIAERLYEQYETVYSEYGSGDFFICYMKNFAEYNENPFFDYTHKSFENRVLDTLGYLRLDAVYEMYTHNNSELINGFWETIENYLEQISTNPEGNRVYNSRLPEYYDDLREVVSKRSIRDFYKFMFGRGTRAIGSFLPYEVDFFQKYIDHRIGNGMTLSRLDEEMLVATLNSGFRDEEAGMQNFCTGFEDIIGIKTNSNVISAGRNVLFRALPINPKLAGKNK